MQKIFRKAVMVFMILAGILSIKQNAYSEGCTICSDNVPWVNHALQSTYPCASNLYYSVRTYPTNYNEIRIDSIKVMNPQSCYLDSVLFYAEKKILQSSLSLFASTPSGGTIRMKKPSCYNPTTFLSCDTNCYSTEYTIGKHTNSDSLWYSIDLAVNYTNSFCGTTGGSCLNKSNIYTPTSTVLASQPAGPSDAECEDKCFWKLTGNSISDLYDDKSTLYPFYMGTRTPKDVVFKRNGIEKMRLGVEGLGVGQKNPAETMHVGDFFTFHTGANFYSFGFNDYYASDGIRKRWENRSIGSPEKQFSGALTFYSSQYNGDGAIELGTAGLGFKEEVLNYTESNNLAGHNLGYKGLVIRPTPLSTTNNYGLIGLGTFPSENNTRVLIKGMGNDNLSAALNVTNNAGNSKLYVRDDGRIGINNSNPTSLLHLKGLGNTNATSSLNIVDNNTTPNTLLIVQDNGNVGIGTNTNLTHKLTINGKVQIGTNKVSSNSTYYSTYMLSVDGDIIAPKVVVSNSEWADFVFDKNYKLATLEEVEKHINENKHLKGIPTESEVKNNGVDIGAMNVKLLQKVEELTLYMIQLKKESDRLSSENKEIKEKLSKIRRK